MEEGKNFIENLAAAALENNIRIFEFAIISNEGLLVFQTENLDLSTQMKNILDVMKGENPFVLSNVEYEVVESFSEGIIGTNKGGKGHVIFKLYQGGILITYAQPQEDPNVALVFLNSFIQKFYKEK